MKLIMTVLLSLLLLPIFQSNSVAGNSVYIQQDNQDVNGSIYIKPNEILSNLGVGSGNYDITVDFLQQLGSYTQLDNTYGFESNYGTTPNDIFAPEYFSEDITTFGEQHYIKTPSKIADYYSEYGWYGTMENILPGSYCSNYDCGDGSDEAFID